MADVPEFNLYITPDGQTFPLYHENVQHQLMEAGLGIINGLVQFFTRRAPLQDGATVVSMRLNERTISMVLARKCCNREDYWVVRAHLLNIFRANRWTAGPYSRPLPGTLRKILPNRDEIRDLYVFNRIANISSPAPDQIDIGWTITLDLEFLAADPLFYGTEVETAFALTDAGGLRFPAAFSPNVAGVNRWIFSPTTLATVQTFTNAGTVHAYPIITVVGPASQVSIHNLTTDESISLTATVPAGVTLTIDLTFGNKQATDDAGNDYSGDLEGDVAEFHLACEPEAANGQNQISVIVIDADADTSVTIAASPPYMGI